MLYSEYHKGYEDKLCRMYCSNIQEGESLCTHDSYQEEEHQTIEECLAEK
jgi:hypothetical protein